MFKIPGSIKIGLSDYLIRTEYPQLGATLGGEINFQTGEITLRACMTEAMTHKTFIHEVLHGIIIETSSAFEKDVLVNVENIEEHICKQLETGLAQVIEQIVEFNIPKYSAVSAVPKT